MDYWQTKYPNLPQKLNHLREGDLYCNCEFIFSNKVVRCHKLVLAAVSPVFEVMFYGSLAKKQNVNVPINVTDINYDIFKQMIQWIYNNDIKVTTCDNACELYQASKKYMLKELLMVCACYLEENINCNNVLQLYEFAKFHCEKKLEDLCMKLIQDNISEVLKSETLKNVSESTLCNILDMKELKISSELLLVNAVEQWANAEALKRGVDCPRSVANNLVHKLCFHSLTIDEFISGPAKSKLLTDIEKLEIILRINKPDLPPMKSSLTKNVMQRRFYRRMVACLQLQDTYEKRCSSSMSFCTWVSTNTKINLLGIMVNVQSKQRSNESYTEDMIVEVSSRSGDEYWAVFNDSVCYNSKQEIMFNNDTQLQPNTDYLVRIFLLKAGTYKVGSLPSLFDGDDGVVLDLGSDEDYYVVNDGDSNIYHETILNAIVYSKCKD